jgi:amino acid permease
MATGGELPEDRAPQTGAQTPGSARSGQPDPAAGPARRGSRRGREPSANMLPGRNRRRSALERFLVRLIATGGVIGIGVVLGAILHSSGEQGWIIGLVVAVVTVVLSAILWSSRQL